MSSVSLLHLLREIASTSITQVRIYLRINLFCTKPVSRSSPAARNARTASLHLVLLWSTSQQPAASTENSRR